MNRGGDGKMKGKRSRRIRAKHWPMRWFVVSGPSPVPLLIRWSSAQDYTDWSIK